MRKFYKVGFYVMLGIFVAMFFISAGPVGRWPFVQTQKVTFQYGQYIDDISADTLAIRSPATFVVVMDSLALTSIVTDVKLGAAGGEAVNKITKVGSFCMILLNAGADTFFISTDTTKL